MSLADICVGVSRGAEVQVDRGEIPAREVLTKDPALFIRIPKDARVRIDVTENYYLIVVAE